MNPIVKTTIFSTVLTLIISVIALKSFYEYELYKFCLNDEKRKDEITADCRKEIREFEFKNGKLLAF